MGDRSVRRRAAVLLALGALAGTLSAVGSVAPVAPAGASSLLPAAAYTNVAYAPAMPAGSRGHLLDLFLPARRADQPVPLFIYTEGSGWASDQGKVSGAAWAARLNPMGFAVAGVSVRSSSQVTFPGQVHDIKAAIRWLRANAPRFAVDPGRFAVSGASSGGWNATMAGVANDVDPADVGVDLEGSLGVTGVSSRVQAVVAIMAPSAFRLADGQATEHTVLVAGTPDSPFSQMTGCTAYATGVMDPACTNAELADPRAYVTADDPPFLVLHGDRDELVPPGQPQVLYDELSARCVETEYHLLNGPGHNYGYLADQSAVTGQTVQHTDGASCETTTTTGLAPGTVPSFAMVARFLDRTMGRAAAPVYGPVSAVLAPLSVAGRSARVALTVLGGDTSDVTGVTVSSSNDRVVADDRVVVEGAGDGWALRILTSDRGRTDLTVTITRGLQSVTRTLHVVVGGPRADVLRGGDGPDVLVGLGGRDVLRGRGGDDLLAGGRDDDLVSGGAGADRFVGPRRGDRWPDFDPAAGDTRTH